jgi:hypothetical protein
MTTETFEEQNQFELLEKNVIYFAENCMDKMPNPKTGYSIPNYSGFETMYYFCKENNIESTTFAKWIATKPHPYLDFSKEKLENALQFYSINNKYNVDIFQFLNFSQNVSNICHWLLDVFQYELSFIETLFVKECNIQVQIPDLQYLQKLYQSFPNISQKTFEDALTQLCKKYDNMYERWDDDINYIIKKQFLIAKWLLETKPKIATSQCMNVAFVNACKNDNLNLAKLLFNKNPNIEVEIDDEEHNKISQNLLENKFCKLFFKVNTTFLQNLQPMTNEEIINIAELYDE